MKQTSKNMVSVLIALGLVIVALVMFFDMIQPEYAQVMQTKGQITAENQLYANEQSAVATAKKVIAEFQSQQDSGETSVALALPTQEDVAGAVAQIYGLAQNNGILVSALGLSAPTLETLQLQGNPSSTGIARPVGMFTIQISAAGSYENFNNFLQDLETNIRLFDLKSVTFGGGGSGVPNQPPSSQSASTPSKAVANPDSFTYNLTVATYYQSSGSLQ